MTRQNLYLCDDDDEFPFWKKNQYWDDSAWGNWVVHRIANPLGPGKLTERFVNKISALHSNGQVYVVTDANFSGDCYGGATLLGLLIKRNMLTKGVVFSASPNNLENQTNSEIMRFIVDDGTPQQVLEIQQFFEVKKMTNSTQKASTAAAAILAYEVERTRTAARIDIDKVAHRPSPIYQYPKQIRARLWHAVKNQLLAHSHGNIDSAEIIWLLDLLHVWEIEENGKSDSSKLAIELKSLIEDNDPLTAATLAAEYYSRLRINQRARKSTSQKKVGSEPVESNGKPYFEILVVDDSIQDLDTAFEQLGWLAKSVEDKYQIDIILVDPTKAYLSALERIESHPAIQAVVVDWDLASGSSDSEIPLTQQNGVELSKEIHRRWPWIHMNFITGRDVMQIIVNSPNMTIRPFNKQDSMALEEIFASILSTIAERCSTPFFTALKEYSSLPYTIMHGTIGRARSIRKSPGWLKQFLEFYGRSVFNSESSSTQPPLDSLFDPKGPILKAQQMAARTFGATKTVFVTNGTSTANKIVHQSLLRPENTVLIDRNCHKSHHYALALSGARPVYLQADLVHHADEFTGLFKGIRLNEILAALDNFPEAKMLCLTNCTFDGYIHNTENIVREVRNKLESLFKQKRRLFSTDDFIFFFDEAWFGFARFVDALMPYTAMAVAELNPQVRIYSTQSTHKTLTAFRQGSMIHIHDPYFSDVVEANFLEAFYTHTTTSPSYNIIASLDVGRMQADLDGPTLCSEAWTSAIALRENFSLMEKEFQDSFHCLTEKEMDDSGEFIIDLTKLTVFIKNRPGWNGVDIQRLLNLELVQVNKVTPSTVLFMVNSGSTLGSTGHVLTSLRKIMTQNSLAGHSRATPKTAHFENFVQFIGDDNDLRGHFFQTAHMWKDVKIEILTLRKCRDLHGSGMQLVSVGFVIPYPPGFPVLVPGQVIDIDAIDLLESLDLVEVHGMPLRIGIFEPL